MKFKISIVAVMMTLGAHAFASTVAPVYSESSFDDAGSKCKAGGGTVVGHSMETTTADQDEFYIVACQRPVDGGVTYTVAWSDSGFADARTRCTTDSSTTGLVAGEAAGTPLYAQPSQPDIFIVICRK